MTKEKRSATTAVADRCQRANVKDPQSDERHGAATHQQKIEDELERQMRSALIDAYRALAGEEEADHTDVELVSTLIH